MPFDARTNELRELIRKEIPLMQGTGPEQLERLKEQKVLLDAVDKWAGLRTTRLTKLPEIVEKMDGNAERAFYEESIAIRAEMRPMYDCLRTSDVKSPSLAALKIVTQGGQEENKLQTALEACLPVASAMDQIVRYNRELTEKMAALKAKWNETEKIAAAIVRDEKTVIEDVARVMREAVEAEAPLHMNKREKIRAWAKTTKEALKIAGLAVAAMKGVPIPVPPPPPPPDVVKDPVDTGNELMGPWDKMAGDLEARKARFAAYFSNDHESLLVMFLGTRRDAQDFVDKHDYTRIVLDWTSKARGAIDALRSAATSSGQKTDAEALAARFSSALEKAEREAKSRWDTFVTENKAKFFGALAPDLQKALVGQNWDASYAKIATIDLQGLLQRWIGDLKREIEEIDWSEMPDSWRDPLRARMRASLETLAKTEEEKIRNNAPDAVMFWMQAKWAQLTGKLPSS